MSGVDWRANDEAIIARHDADVRAVGLGDVWDEAINRHPDMTRGVILGCLGAVATFMHETGTVRPSP